MPSQPRASQVAVPARGSDPYQLDLFRIGTRDEGQERIDWNQGGLRSLHVERLKSFATFDIEFDSMNLLVGANNSGKTSILQAVRLFFWCISQCGRKEGGKVKFKKAVLPFSEFRLVPAHELKELCYKCVSPNTRARGIVLNGVLANGVTLSFTIYAAYSILMVVDPTVHPDVIISPEQLDVISRAPLYIPGFFGVVTQELLSQDARLEELLNSGHHNEVLRNMILRLRSNPEAIARLRERIAAEFHIEEIDIPFEAKKSEFLRAAYTAPGNRASLDLVSAGSGFLQVLQVLAHSLQNPSPILLLDEPDAHMHSALQRSFLRLLRSMADQDGVQIIMASHSETFIRNVQLGEVRVVDSARNRAESFVNAALLEQNLSEVGVWPDRLELAEVLRTKRALLLEGCEDTALVDHFGRLLKADWDIRRRLTQVVYTRGSDESTVSKLVDVQKILTDLVAGGIRLAYLRDRDLLTDESLSSLRDDAANRGLNLFILERRNREAYLADPLLVARVVFQYFASKLPDALQKESDVAVFVKKIVLDWCREELDTLPSKIHEYNLSWLRKSFPEQDEQRQAKARIDAYIRTHWTEPVNREEIPWSLVDGKAVLRKVRTSFQSFGISELTDERLLETKTAADCPNPVSQFISLVYDWTTTKGA